ncbi:hypothetical protein TVAG_574210 [Trichomonas vaginalis G3]|uniref:Uncharacterized protein n=1 Tax=Trichomonas vaginalis (strain ATCC PRA-98 / G3) TaxID=412133 RepID=A2HNL0_TRIV3|nr:hypothetical protein TVAG_574210 [Trichomonas vaginalis G3]|eukprot:XP_001281937.1 hypothetical protein [Trichomonas vaginalis G3]
MFCHDLFVYAWSRLLRICFVKAYEGGVEDVIPSKNLRESKSTHLGPLEREYWKNKNKPERIRKFF